MKRGFRYSTNVGGVRVHRTPGPDPELGPGPDPSLTPFENGALSRTSTSSNRESARTSGDGKVGVGVEWSNGSDVRHR